MVPADPDRARKTYEARLDYGHVWNWEILGDLRVGRAGYQAYDLDAPEWSKINGVAMNLQPE